MNMAERTTEVIEKIARMRQWVVAYQAGAIRLRGTDWFAWATAGGSNTVLLTTDTGVAEILITQSQAHVLTDEIEAERLGNEEVPPGFAWHVEPWASPEVRERFVQEAAGGSPVLSDRPGPGELPLPAVFREQRWSLNEDERARYRQVGLAAAQAMSEVMRAARPEWTEFELAGAGAEALWGRGLHPALTLAAGETRLPRYRHPTASREKLGGRAMLVFCARGFGLYANLTRFVQFASVSPELESRQQAVRAIEAAGLQSCRPGRTLAQVYGAFEQAYEAAGFAQAIREHHQGGITAYLAREVVATPQTGQSLAEGMALAFNPSLAGTKIEDTFLIQGDRLENLTLDPAWPSIECQGLMRPLPLEAK